MMKFAADSEYAESFTCGENNTPKSTNTALNHLKRYHAALVRNA